MSAPEPEIYPDSDSVVLPIMLELMDNLRDIHTPVTLANGITICKHSLDTYPCSGASAVLRAEGQMKRLGL